MKNNEYSENNRAKNLLGLRGEELKFNNIIPINLPWELGYVCPICKKPGELLA